MKLVNILLSQAIRLGKISGASGGTVYGVNLSRACEDRYGFLQGPRTLAEYDLSKGVTFLHGYFEGRFVIDRFQVFDNGFLAEARIDTDECEAFLEDVIKWIAERGGIKFEQESAPPKLYLSQLEVQSEVDIGNSFAKVAPIGKIIADALRSYGQITQDWELSGLSFGWGGGDAASFKFERREGPAVPRNVFFATSRMRTRDHLYILGQLEIALMTSAA